MADPQVTIGLPTHNGEQYLAAALEALLAQDQPSFEILVSDNASTDATPAIIRSFVDRDPRVRFERSDELVSAAQNFNRVLAGARGPYFLWAADDDLWEPSYVRRCVSALEGTPAAVMACTSIEFIDPTGAVRDVDRDRYDNPDLSSNSVVARIQRLLRRGGWYQIYGVARRSALERTHLVSDTYGPDVVLTLELALQGPILKVPERLFRYRQFPGRSESARVARQGSTADPGAVVAARMTHLQESLVAAVWASDLAFPMKVRVVGEILRAVYLDDTPMGRVARSELSTRRSTARRDRNAVAYAKFLALGAVAARGRPVGAAGGLIRRGRRAAGRLARRLR